MGQSHGQARVNPDPVSYPPCSKAVSAEHWPTFCPFLPAYMSEIVSKVTVNNIQPIKEHGPPQIHMIP